MTLKEINKMACEDCIGYLRIIDRIKANLCYKTEWEKVEAIKEIKRLSKEIQDLISRIELD